MFTNVAYVMLLSHYIVKLLFFGQNDFDVLTHV